MVLQHRLMDRVIVALSLAVAIYALAAAVPLVLGADDGGPPPNPAEEQPEVLTSGPVHEAFAQPINTDVQAPVVATAEPPAPIEETPSADRPAAAGVIWVPGYWAWEADRANYVWVSACWRVAPPNRTWAPGYWNPISGGWEWVAGYWGPAGATDVEYLPAPPSVESVDPVGVAPALDRTWVPPCYYWHLGQYVHGPAIGWRCTPAGCGSHRITSGRPAATSLLKDTGTANSNTAACCLRRFVSRVPCGPGRASSTRPRW